MRGRESKEGWWPKWVKGVKNGEREGRGELRGRFRGHKEVAETGGQVTQLYEKGRGGYRY